MTDSHNLSNITKNMSITTEPPPKPSVGGYMHLLVPNLYPVVEVQEMFSSHGSLITIAMNHHGETLNKLTHNDETKKRAHDSHIVIAKENLKLSHGWASFR